jgi:methyl-accepting chemotaxis protein
LQKAFALPSIDQRRFPPADYTDRNGGRRAGRLRATQAIAKATGEISAQINGIQAATTESVVAIREIGDTIGKMSEIASTIASAVEQQGAATQEISRNVQQAAHGTQQVSANITVVQRGAGETSSASAQVLSAARALSSESKRLKLEVGNFLNSVRAA